MTTAEVNCERGGCSFPDLALRGLSGKEEASHKRGYMAFHCLVPQSLSRLVEASCGIGGTASPDLQTLERPIMEEKEHDSHGIGEHSFPDLAEKAIPRRGAWIPEVFLALGRPAVEHGVDSP